MKPTVKTLECPNLVPTPSPSPTSSCAWCHIAGDVSGLAAPLRGKHAWVRHCPGLLGLWKRMLVPKPQKFHIPGACICEADGKLRMKQPLIESRPTQSGRELTGQRGGPSASGRRDCADLLCVEVGRPGRPRELLLLELLCPAPWRPRLRLLLRELRSPRIRPAPDFEDFRLRIFGLQNRVM